MIIITCILKTISYYTGECKIVIFRIPYSLCFCWFSSENNDIQTLRIIMNSWIIFLSVKHPLPLFILLDTLPVQIWPVGALQASSSELFYMRLPIFKHAMLSLTRYIHHGLTLFFPYLRPEISHFSKKTWFLFSRKFYLGRAKS